MNEVVMHRLTPAILLFLFLSAPAHTAPSATELEFFESKIRPVLAEKCYSCHSVNAEKLKGDLLVDHIQSLLEGGEAGPSIVPGKPEESMLIEVISYKNIDLQMPPKSKLSDEVIADFTKWVEMGAPWPQEPLPSGNIEKAVFDWKSRRDSHWCWQPIIAKEPPAVGDAWSRKSLDHFIYKRLLDEGLEPAEETDRRTWIRRVYFALIGLPPTREQVQAFLSDVGESAYEKVVDELLASPHFGERWGRHWLDLARYAESCGHEFDYTLERAYEYRDYVIRAFNEDVPYDQFMTEQVAGDLMPHPRRNQDEEFNESIIGTGFWFLHEAVHAPTDVMQDEADRIDNQIDVFGKTFLGLTIACSRCHDHKFDAISAKDYYSLAGYLQSSRMDYAMLDPHGKIGDVVEELNQLRDKLADGDAQKKWVGRYLFAAQRAMDWKEPLPEVSTDEKLLSADKVFEGFEQGTYKGWTISGGKAFGEKPSTGNNGKGQKAANWVGRYFVNTWPGTDAETGVAKSAEFVIEHDYVNFLIGGGDHNGKTCMQLLVDNKAVYSATGKNSDTMSWRSWDVRAHRGKRAAFKIVDTHKESWGHILVDEITFSDRPVREGAADKGMVPGAVLAKVAQMGDLDADLLAKYIAALNHKDVSRDSHPLFAWKTATKKPDSLKDFVNLVKDQEQFLPQGTVVADFDDGSFGECFVTGFAFGEHPVDGVADSGVLSKKLEGVLRTPTFTLSGPVHVRVKAHEADIRMIVDGYQMQTRNGLLFGGTAHRKVKTNGEWQWSKLWNEKYKGHKVYIEFLDHGPGVIAVDQVVIGDPPKHRMHPVNREVFAANPRNLKELGRAYSALSSIEWFIEKGLMPSVDDKFEQELADLERRLPAPRKVLAIADGTGENDYVYIRGNPHTKGELAPRQLPVAIFGENQPKLGAEDGSGRLLLAEALCNPSNPFPSRVMVNRIWHHLFGRGIVASVDDFGEMGQEPSHPELLDYLAHDFIHHRNWSVKQAIKEIVLSSTYRQSSRPNDAHRDAEAKDPENILLHRMPIRRLEAEPIRDAMYAISGRLDTKMFGPSVPVHLTRFQGGRGKPGSGPIDGNGRRSVYLAVRRNFMSAMMLTFDYPTPFNSIGRRTVSNVPAQALVMMNNPAIVDEAKRWGKEIVRAGSTPEERISQAFEQAFARLPTAQQMSTMMQFVEAQSKVHGGDVNHEGVWSDLCHVLFNMKEFIYIN